LVCGTSIRALGKKPASTSALRSKSQPTSSTSLNHPNFFDPQVNINNPKNFGVISQQLIPADRTQGSRWIELGLRVSF
jgi:hypothetical protein